MYTCKVWWTSQRILDSGMFKILSFLLYIYDMFILNMSHRKSCRSLIPWLRPAVWTRSTSGLGIKAYLELVPGMPSPGLRLRSAPLTKLSGLWRVKLAFWVTSFSMLFLMAISRTFFSFCCSTTWAFLGAMALPLQRKTTIPFAHFQMTLQSV